MQVLGGLAPFLIIAPAARNQQDLTTCVLMQLLRQPGSN